MRGESFKYSNYVKLAVITSIIILSLIKLPINTDFHFFVKLQSIKLPLVSLLLFFYFLFKLSIKQFKEITFSFIDVLLLIFIALSFFSASYARNPKYAINIGCIWIVHYGVFKLFQSNISNKWIKKNVIIALTTTLIIALIYFLYFIFTMADYSNGLFNILNDELLKELHQSLQLHRNNVSSLFVIVAGIPFYFIAKSKNTAQLVLSLFFLGLFFFTLTITRSRGSLLAFTFVASLVLFLFGYRKIVNSKVIFACLVTLFITGFCTLQLQSDKKQYVKFLSPFYGVMSAEGDDRLEMWEISYRLFKEKPILGYGAGNWEFEYQKYGAGDLKNHNHSRYFHYHSHSYYVNIFFCYGIIGGLAFVLIMILSPILKLVEKNNTSELKLPDVIWFSGVAAFLIISLFYGTTYNNINTFQGQPVLFFIFLGCIYADENKPSYKIHLFFLITALFCSSFYYIKCWQNSNVINIFHGALNKKNYTKCEILLKKLDDSKFGYIGRKPNVNILWYRFNKKQKKYNEMAQNLKKVLEVEPYNYVHYDDLGDALFKQKKIKPAKEAYEKSILYNCDYIPASIGLLKCEALLSNKKQFEIIKNNLLYINDYIVQYERNKQSWSKHKKLVYFYKIYKNYRKDINKIKIAEK